MGNACCREERVSPTGARRGGIFNREGDERTMKIGIFTALFHDRPIEEALDIIAARSQSHA
jgi:hypothetical protein